MYVDNPKFLGNVIATPEYSPPEQLLFDQKLILLSKE